MTLPKGDKTTSASCEYTPCIGGEPILMRCLLSVKVEDLHGHPTQATGLGANPTNVIGVRARWVVHALRNSTFSPRVPPIDTCAILKRISSAFRSQMTCKERSLAPMGACNSHACMEAQRHARTKGPICIVIVKGVLSQSFCLSASEILSRTTLTGRQPFTVKNQNNSEEHFRYREVRHGTFLL